MKEILITLSSQISVLAFVFVLVLVLVVFVLVNKRIFVNKRVFVLVKTHFTQMINSTLNILQTSKQALVFVFVLVNKRALVFVLAFVKTRVSVIPSVFVLVLVLAFTNCVSKKNIVYFQNDRINQEAVSNDFVTTFKPDDLLQITISAKDMVSVQPFNLPIANFMTGGVGAFGQPVLQNYLIDAEGYIDFPVLGRLELGGKTREEVLQLFKEKLDPDYVKNPTINIFISNFSVTVTGDVGRPGRYTIPNERVTIMEAIGLAGDLNLSAQRENIKVIREENGQKNVYTVDLLSNELFTSPAYYLQQNDLIYVEPNYAKAQGAAANPNNGIFLSITSLLITIAALLIR